MASLTSPIGLLDVCQVVVRRWPLAVGVPVAAAALVYFLAPSAPPNVTGTASLATNDHPTLPQMDSAVVAAAATGRIVIIQEDGARITATTTAPSEDEAKAALDAAMNKFTSAKLFEGERRAVSEASKERLEAELQRLQGALTVRTSSPPEAGSGEYNPSTYAATLLPLSGRISELSERLFLQEQAIDRPLAVSGNVAYNFTVQRSSSRLLLTVLAGLAVGFVTLLWLVTLEALRRREESIAT